LLLIFLNDPDSSKLRQEAGRSKQHRRELAFTKPGGNVATLPMKPKVCKV